MSKFKIAKQIPYKILVKRIFKRVLPQKSINYSAKDDRSCNSDFKINSLIDVASAINEFKSEVITNYIDHKIDLLS